MKGKKFQKPVRNEREPRRENLRRDHRDSPRRNDREEPRRNTNVIFGVLPVLEALRSSNRRVERVAIAEGVREHRLNDIFDLAREHGIIVDRVSRDRIDKMVGPGQNHQGIAAVSAAADYVDGYEILESLSDPALLLLLDGVEDPRNLGAILRTAECAGVDGVFIPERRAVGLTDTVAKSSAGAIEHVRVAKATNMNRLIDDLKERNIWVVGTSGDAEMDYTEWDWTTPSALVMGSEGDGLHRLVAENCDALVKIPMYGKIGSLNVSVATGVVLFEALRQRAARK